MATSRHEGSLVVTETLSAGFMVIPTNSINNDSIIATANIDATKCQQQYVKSLALSANATSAAVTRQVIHAVYGLTGTVIEFAVGATVAPTGGDSVTVTLLKNGTTILTANVVLNNTSVNFVPVEGTISSGSVVAGDILEVNVSAVSGTTCKGLFARLVIRETPN
jgi:hypothetical protein